MLAKKVVFLIEGNFLQKKVGLGVGGTTEPFPLLSIIIFNILCGVI